MRKISGTFAIYSPRAWSPYRATSTPHRTDTLILRLWPLSKSMGKKKLRQSEKELQQIIDAVPQHIFVLWGRTGSRICILIRSRANFTAWAPNGSSGSTVWRCSFIRTIVESGVELNGSG